MDSPSKMKQQSELCRDLALWMTNLPSKLKAVPLIHLAIPGSHDSFTSTITSSSKVSPDAESVVQSLNCMGPILGLVLTRWTRTQEYDVVEQLNSGIRYFDLRIATKDGTEQLFLVHGQYSVDVVSVLNEVENFLDSHTREVVILDCQHFHAFIRRDHVRFMQLLRATFGPKLLPYSQQMGHITLDYMMGGKYQVIVIYRSDEARFQQPLFWPSANFPTPWPEAENVNKLLTILTDGLARRPPNLAYISQCVLTPTTWFVCKNIFSNLKRTCVLPLEKQKYQWLSKQKPGPGGINIVISDFVDIDVDKFAKEVIPLNEKLLDTPILRSETLTPVDNSI